MPIPPLAGLASYAEAAAIGLSVEENVARLLRYAWIEKRAMEAGLYWLAPVPEWEVKEALGLHLHLDATHAAALRQRIGEMRNPVPRLDVVPDAALDRFFDEMLGARDTLEKLVGLYGVLKPALIEAYHAHIAACHPIADYPTRHMLRHLLLDEEESLAWGQAALAALSEEPAGAARAAAWANHLAAYLAAAGGVAGTGEHGGKLPPSQAPVAAEPDFTPQRDARFALRWNFLNPQRQVSLDEAVPLDERILALMCRRIVEMDVPEYMTRVIALAQGEPWEYYVAMTRQLWDEVRHAMLGSIYFESRGVDWRGRIAIHPGMALRLGRLPVQDAHLVLYAIEQSLMPGSTGKRLEYEVSRNSGDALAAQIQDYDWADEVLHVQTGRTWLLPRLGMNAKDAVQRGWEMRATTVDVLAEYEGRAEQVNWWPAFVCAVLGRPTAKSEFDLRRL